MNETQRKAVSDSLELMRRMRDDAAANGDHSGAAELDAAIREMEVTL